MLRKEEEFEQNGAMSGQKLADELYGVRHPQENALPATTLHQTFRGSGFRGGRVIPRGWPARNTVTNIQLQGSGSLRSSHGTLKIINFADIFTNPLATVRFRDLRSVLVQNLDGIANNTQFLRRTFSVLRDFITLSSLLHVQGTTQSTN